MTLEELQAQVKELKDSNDALAAKNKELLGEVKVFKAKAKGADIDPEAYAALQTEVEELRGTLDKSGKASKSEIEKLTKALGEKDGALQSYLIDGGLTEALVKVGVSNPVSMKAAKAMLRAQASIKADGGQYQAVMGDKPLSDAVAAWAATDEGKHFIAAPTNSGGGAGGGGGKPPANKGDLGGDKKQRVAALAARFPELNS